MLRGGAGTVYVRMRLCSVDWGIGGVGVCTASIKLCTAAGRREGSFGRDRIPLVGDVAHFGEMYVLVCQSLCAGRQASSCFSWSMEHSSLRLPLNDFVDAAYVLLRESS